MGRGAKYIESVGDYGTQCTLNACVCTHVYVLNVCVRLCVYVRACMCVCVLNVRVCARACVCMCVRET
jgi:hypothetical protein